MAMSVEKRRFDRNFLWKRMLFLSQLRDFMVHNRAAMNSFGACICRIPFLATTSTKNVNNGIVMTKGVSVNMAGIR
ncbi:hypothetical protein KIN20_016829 [Parelaphostrongylus tenuis]|uniref:Uncharacterized protein n=1 Tax=Parelaphostrongylus tenuis TaxID=148309 RepID=A0AAD5N5S5_PARTN|nr:hypothetical protein KIN20_016829 [Parelaphostrongylus tenuis]